MARRVQSQRSMKTSYQGPRPASWTVYEISADGRRRPLVTTGSAVSAHQDAAYYRTECGYAVEVERIEFCPVAACEGFEPTVKVRGRHGMYKERPCRAHVEPAVLVES